MDWGPISGTSKICFSPKMPSPHSGGHTASMGTQRGGGGLFLRGYSGWSVKDTTELHLVQKLRMSL